MGINFLGHFALIKALLPCLETTGKQYYQLQDSHQPRIILLSSTLHQFSQPDPAKLLVDVARGHEHDRQSRIKGFASAAVLGRDPYPDSKLALLLLAQELNRLPTRVRTIAALSFFCPCSATNLCPGPDPASFVLDNTPGNHSCGRSGGEDPAGGQWYKAGRGG